MNLYKGLKRFAILLALVVCTVFSFVVEDVTGRGTGEIGGIIGGFELFRCLLFLLIISLIIYWIAKSFSHNKSKDAS